MQTVAKPQQQLKQLPEYKPSNNPLEYQEGLLDSNNSRSSPMSNDPMLPEKIECICCGRKEAMAFLPAPNFCYRFFCCHQYEYEDLRTQGFITMLTGFGVTAMSLYSLISPFTKHSNATATDDSVGLASVTVYTSAVGAMAGLYTASKGFAAVFCVISKSPEIV